MAAITVGFALSTASWSSLPIQPLRRKSSSTTRLGTTTTLQSLNTPVPDPCKLAPLAEMSLALGGKTSGWQAPKLVNEPGGCGGIELCTYAGPAGLLFIQISHDQGGFPAPTGSRVTVTHPAGLGDQGEFQQVSAPPKDYGSIASFSLGYLYMSVDGSACGVAPATVLKLARDIYSRLP